MTTFLILVCEYICAALNIKCKFTNLIALAKYLKPRFCKMHTYMYNEELQ